ncbi:MAG TPA: hypothetical protein VGF95_02660 [Solirubrobacteraceae bacterium]
MWITPWAVRSVPARAPDDAPDAGEAAAPRADEPDRPPDAGEAADEAPRASIVKTSGFDTGVGADAGTDAAS